MRLLTLAVAICIPAAFATPIDHALTTRELSRVDQPKKTSALEIRSPRWAQLAAVASVMSATGSALGLFLAQKECRKVKDSVRECLVLAGVSSSSLERALPRSDVL